MVAVGTRGGNIHRPVRTTIPLQKAETPEWPLKHCRVRVIDFLLNIAKPSVVCHRCSFHFSFWRRAYQLRFHQWCTAGEGRSLWLSFQATAGKRTIFLQWAFPSHAKPQSRYGPASVSPHSLGCPFLPSLPSVCPKLHAFVLPHSYRPLHHSVLWGKHLINNSH